METKFLTPILNVSSIEDSFAWFDKLGWTPSLQWGEPTTFGGVVNGDVQIFMCENGQGGRGTSGRCICGTLTAMFFVLPKL